MIGCPKELTTNDLIFKGVDGAGVVVVTFLVVGALVVVGAAVVVVNAVVVVDAAVVVVTAGVVSVTTAAGRTTPFWAVIELLLTTAVVAFSVTDTTGFSVKISTNFTSSGFSGSTASFLPGLWNFLPVLNRGPKNCSAVKSVLTGLFSFT